MPQTMPSIVSMLRVGLRVRASSACRKISLNIAASASRLEPQRLDRIDRRGAARRIKGREDRDRAEETEGEESRLPGREQAGEELRHRQEVHERAEAVREAQPEGAAHEHDDEGLEEELPQDGARGRP